MRRRLAWALAALATGACSANSKMEPAAAAPPADMAAAPPAVAAPPAEVALAIQRRPAAVAAPIVAADSEWAVVREFPVPDYSQPYDGPRVDFRDTVFWAPRVETGADGAAELSFYLSDAVTTFRAVAEGVSPVGPGRGEAELVAALPISVAARVPVAVSAGDRIRLPVTVTSASERGQRVRVRLEVGPAFELAGRAERAIWVSPRRPRTLHYLLRVVDAAADSGVRLSASAGALTDVLERRIAVVPRGFPVELAASGTLKERAVHTLELPGDAASIAASVRLYPSPVASLVEGAEALLREPVGCFEQASSANYPNVMVLRHLEEAGALEPAVAASARATLARGYQRLTGYESASRGFEWFGGDPGHEALTAYGLMQFSEMAAVYPEVDRALIERTADWLESRRDGEGGYGRNSRALDTFGRASEEVTSAYITYALTQVGRRDLDAELDRLRALVDSSRDPYLLALAAGALLEVDPADPAGEAALDALVARQDGSGRITGASHSITRSGGAALDIETTALAALALMEAKTPRPAALARALDWIRSQRGGAGNFSSTQATILALRALTAAQGRTRLPAGATVTVLVNGERVATIDASAAAEDGAIEIGDLARHLRPGENAIELRAEGGAVELPYSIGLSYRRLDPPTSPEAAVRIDTRLSRRFPRLGQSVRLTATVQNTTSRGLPMTVARVGIPGGLEAQTWQLDELVERGAIDFYETGAQEVVLYWRQLAPGQTARVPIELLAAVAGRYQSPPSSAYLYYTDEHQHWSAPLSVRVRPRFSRSKR